MQFVGYGRSWAEAEQNAKQQAVEYRLNQEFAQAFAPEFAGFLGIIIKLVVLILKIAFTCFFRPWAGLLVFTAFQVATWRIPELRHMNLQVTPIAQSSLADNFHMVIMLGVFGLIVGLLTRLPEVYVELPLLKVLRRVMPAAMLQWLAVAAYAAFGGLVGWELCRIGWLVPPGPH